MDDSLTSPLSYIFDHAPSSIHLKNHLLGQTLHPPKAKFSKSLSHSLQMACSSCVLKTISCLVKQPNQRSHPTSSLTSSTLLSFKLSNPSLTQTLKLHSTLPQIPIFSLPKRSFPCISQTGSSDSAGPSKYFSHLLTQPPLFALQNYTFWLDPI